MPDGKPGLAPCGHVGVHVIGTYVQCTAGCDRVTPPLGVDFAMVHRCPACKSINTEDWDLGVVFYAYNPTVPVVDSHCIDCGKVFAR